MIKHMANIITIQREPKGTVKRIGYPIVCSEVRIPPEESKEKVVWIWGNVTCHKCNIAPGFFE